ncbi:putative ABC transporter permease [Candidatus Agathobaculum pullicola]|uniref:putative ABC transporter permease n=1 Tax=Candidatus Agathobaculum pullicola TaxID=2838426 RepID=UPI003F931DE2
MTAIYRYMQQERFDTAGRCTLCEGAGLFLVFSIAGWLWEVGLHLLLDGELVNRGTMLGPWLPIYGVGGMLSVLLLGRFIARPLAVFTLGAICFPLRLNLSQGAICWLFTACVGGITANIRSTWTVW